MKLVSSRYLPQTEAGRFLCLQSLHLILDALELFTFIYVLLDYLGAVKYFLPLVLHDEENY
jgi:hypothetical protein